MYCIAEHGTDIIQTPHFLSGLSFVGFRNFLLYHGNLFAVTDVA